jgi:hypothetical protein
MPGFFLSVFPSSVFISIPKSKLFAIQFYIRYVGSCFQILICIKEARYFSDLILPIKSMIALGESLWCSLMNVKHPLPIPSLYMFENFLVFRTSWMLVIDVLESNMLIFFCM